MNNGIKLNDLHPLGKPVKHRKEPARIRELVRLGLRSATELLTEYNRKGFVTFSQMPIFLGREFKYTDTYKWLIAQSKVENKKEMSNELC